MGLDEQERKVKVFDCPACLKRIDLTTEYQIRHSNSGQNQSSPTSAKPAIDNGSTIEQREKGVTDSSVNGSVLPEHQFAQLYPEKSIDELVQLYTKRSEESLSGVEVRILEDELKNRGFIVNSWGEIVKKPKLEETRDTSPQNTTSPPGWQVTLTSNENTLRSNLESKLRIKRWASILLATVIMSIIAFVVLGFVSWIVWDMMKGNDPFPIEWLVAVSIGLGFWVSCKMNPFQTPEQFQESELEAKRAAQQKAWQMSQIICPHCHTRGSVQTWKAEFSQNTLGRDIALMGVTRGMSLVFGTGSSETGIKAHCSHCGTEWRMS
jgi:uncharacterized protein YlaI